jgi:hypothetical protein
MSRSSLTKLMRACSQYVAKRRTELPMPANRSEQGRQLAEEFWSMITTAARDGVLRRIWPVGVLRYPEDLQRRLALDWAEIPGRICELPVGDAWISCLQGREPPSGRSCILNARCQRWTYRKQFKLEHGGIAVRDVGGRVFRGYGFEEQHSEGFTDWLEYYDSVKKELKRPAPVFLAYPTMTTRTT